MDTIDSDSEFSDDSSGSASSSSSSGSSQYEDTTELAKINNQILSLPKGLCENSNIFREFFSMETWKQVPDNFQAYLKNKYLPHFPENNEAQQEKTLQMLFNNEIARFGTSQLESFQQNLEEGNYRPDVLKLRDSITKSRKIEQQFRECERVGNLAKSLMISRERLLRVAYNAPPGSIPKVDHLIDSVPVLDSLTPALRAKKRYYNEISNLTNQMNLSDCSDDEFKIKEEHIPENNICKEELEDKKPTPNNETKIIGTIARRSRLNGANNFSYNTAINLNDNFLKKILLEHKKRKLEEPDRPEFETNDIRITDVHNRAEISGGSYRKMLLAPKIRKPYTKSSNKYQTQQQQLELEQKQQQITQLKYDNDSMNQQQSLLTSSYLKDKKQICSFSGALEASILATVHHHLQSLHDDNSETGESEEEEVNVETINSPKRQLINLPTLRIDDPITTVVDHNSILVKNKNLTLSKTTRKPIINYNGISNEDILNDNHENRMTTDNNSQILYNQQSQQHQQQMIQQQINQQNINIPATIDDLDGIDMMHLPVELDDSLTAVEQNINIMTDITEQQQLPVTATPIQKLEKSKNTPTVGPELMQETHACFLSLIRDIFCATPNHRMKLDELKTQIYNWLSNPITALNDWYNQADNWLVLIPSSIHFLSGEFIDQPDDFVPYIEFKPQQNIYQWIGAGRDSDSHLLQLCQYWLVRKNEMGSKPIQKLDIRNNDGKNRSFELDETLLNEKPVSPPPPRCPTSWTVQVANADEIDEFRIQERQRFENPHKAFTYRMYGFESVVGPVKGVYTQILALTKARGHTMLTADRPNFVTILTLVRDATARLPNGEGTRADICELLKCSQYISPQAAETVLQTIVSGALDRMHVEHDPCVRYDPKRKIWIYLHRNRSEEEFEKLHQQFQGITKNQKKPLSRKIKHKGHKVSENSLLIQNNPTALIQQQQQQQQQPPQQMLSPITNPSQIIQQQIKISTIQNPPIPQQLPALSSISNNNNNNNNSNNNNSNNNNNNNVQQQQKQTTLIGNQTNIGIVSPIKISATNQQQQKTVNILKPELVPIKQSNQQQQQLRSPIIFDKSQNLDIADSIDLNIEPPQFILQKPINYQQKLNIVSSGTGKKITNLHLQNSGGTNVGGSSNNNNNSTINQQQIRVSLSSGIQTINVPPINSPSISQTTTTTTSTISNTNQELQKQIQTNLSSQILTGLTQQTPLISTSINPQQIVITGNKKMIATSAAITTSTTTKPILIQNQQTAGGQIVTQIRSNNNSINNNNNNQQGYIIPLSSDQLQAISSMPGSQTIIASNLSPKFITKNSNQQQQPPGLTATINNRPTLIQQSNINNKNFVRVATTTTSQAGKSLISPHVAATNITLQQQKLLSNIQSNVTVQQHQQPQQTPTLYQPKIITGTTVIRPQLQKNTTGGISLINNSTIRGQTTLTALQQKQILQNLVAQQQKQQQQQRTAGTGLNQNTIVIPSQQVQRIQTKNVIIQQNTGTIPQQQATQQQQIQKIINVSGANIQTVSGQNIITTSQGQAVQQTNFTPQIIQIHQASSTGGPAKIQTINASMLQNFKQHIRLQPASNNSQQQSLIIKQQMLQQLQQQPQQQLQQKSDNTPTTVSVSVGTGSPKTVSSIIGTNFITTNQTSLAPGSVIQTSPQNIIKHAGLQQQQQHQLQSTQQNITKQFTVVSQPQTITRVVKTVSNATGVSGLLQQQPQIVNSMAGVRTQTGNPVMAKVLTNTSGQIISLESLLQKQGVAPGTLRVATGNKPNQTNLIQLAGTPGSQITQYAVVSQGRNLISVSGTPHQQQRLITTQATNSNIVTSLSNNSGNNVGNIKTTATITSGSGTVNMQNVSGTTLRTTVQLQNQSKVIPTNQLTAQQLMNAKVLGKAGTTAIRMVNASNLNIAHIRGKPVIIASKPATTNQQQQQGGNGVNVGDNNVTQNVQIIQNNAINSSGNIVIGGQTVKVQGNVLQSGNIQLINQSSSTTQPQTVMLSNQILKVAQSPIRQQQQQQHQQTVTSNMLNNNSTGNGNLLTTIASTNTGTVVVNSSGLNQNMPKTVVLSSTGQTITGQASNQIQNSGTTSGQNQQIILGATMKGTPIKTTGTGQQRVVLAVQGGGQILLPPGFQGGSINLKSLQGLKVVSLAQQQQQNKGGGQQNQRPMFAQLFTTKSSPGPVTGAAPSSSQTNSSQNLTGNN